MTKNTEKFEINDGLDTSDNLEMFAEHIKSMDAPLASVLKPYLLRPANGEIIDSADIWNWLYAASERSEDSGSDKPDVEKAVVA